MSSKKLGFLATTLLMGAIALPVMGQAAPDGGGQAQGQQGAGGNGNNGGGRGNFDPAAFRQRMMDSLKKELGATDEEFAAMQPKIEKIQTLQRESSPMRMGRGGFGGRRGGQGGPGGDQNNNNAANNNQQEQQPTSDVQAKLKDLQATLEKQDSSAADIKAKLQAYRDAKTAAKAELTKLQDDLKGILTAKQEAVLVTRGVLE